MIALDEDALLCDMVETYQIYDMFKMPVLLIATLAKGLKSDSRIMMAVNGLKVDVKTLLLAHIADNTAINLWLKTEDGQKGYNRPQSLVELLSGKSFEENGFDCGLEFDEEWRKLTSE